MAAMGLAGADFSQALKSRKKFVDANDEAGVAVEGTGSGSDSGNQLAASSAGVQSFGEKSPTGHVGLANQGATCYLNSLLQAMFMLDEFRAALYSWEFVEAEHGDEGRNVARQLQRLFTELQLSERSFVTTMALTRSFGWTTGEQFQQQDVQECSAVIMDYLSRVAAGTPLGDHLAACHAGATNRVLRCTGCGQERGREEVFRDLQLDVKDASTGSMMDPKSQDPLGSVDHALAAYCASETLEGVSCEACGGKHDHEKLLRFSQLPLYLPLVLKRFAMNWSTGQRMKLGDWMSVPTELDLTPLLQPGEAAAAGAAVFRLKSVLMHTGGAYGGHYFCYLQGPGGWCKFNDANVTELTEEEVAKAFALDEPEPEPAPEAESVAPPPPPPVSTAGEVDEAEDANKTAGSAAGTIQAVWKRRRAEAAAGSTQKGKKKAGQPAVGKHAYMVVYVRADGASGATQAPSPPADLIAEVAADNKKFNELKTEWLEERRWLRFKLISSSGKEEDEQEIRILREESVGDLLDRVRECALPSVAREDCRMRVVHRGTGSLLEPLGAEGGEAAVLESFIKTWPAPKIALETRKPGESFVDFRPGSTPIRLRKLAETVAGETVGIGSVAVAKPCTIGGLRQCVASQLGCDLEGVRMVVTTTSDDGRVTAFSELSVGDDYLTLSQKNLKIGSEVIVEDGHNADGEASHLLSHFDKLVNKLEIDYRIASTGTTGTMEIDSRQPLLAMKQRLAADCADIAEWAAADASDDPCDSFKLRLGDRFGGAGKEIKDMSQAMGAVGLTKLNSLVIEQGRPLKPNEYTVNIKLTQLAPLGPPKPAEGVPPPPVKAPPAGGLPPPPPPGGKKQGADDLYSGVNVVVCREDAVADLKQRIVDLADATSGLKVDCMRLRLVENAGKLGAVLVDGMVLSDAVPRGKKLHDGLKIAIQPTHEPETFTSSHLLIRCQRWLPAEMKLDAPPPRELAVESGATTVGDLQATFAQWCNAGSEAGSGLFPVESMHVLKPFGFQLKDAEALSLLWGTKGQPSTDSIVTSGALNCKAGDLLLYKDSRASEQVEPPPVTEDGASAKPERVEAPGFMILTPDAQLAREQAAAEKRQPQGQMAVDLEERMAVLKANDVGAGGGGIARTNSL